MELRLLEYFLTVVREENISKAAEVLHVTQPTLSRQMKELEDELGTTLFIRGKRLTLTDAGVMLRRRAEEVVLLMQKIDSEFREQEEISGVVSVGSGGLKAAEILPELIGHFRERYPLVSFELHTGTADHVKERLEHGLLDFGILLEPVDIEKFDYLRLPAKETWGLLMSADHPLAREKSITRKQLKGQPLVVTSRTALRGEIEEWLRCPISEPVRCPISATASSHSSRTAATELSRASRTATTITIAMMTEAIPIARTAAERTILFETASGGD